MKKVYDFCEWFSGFSGIGFFSAEILKKAAYKRTARFFQDSPGNFHLMIKGGDLHEVQNRTGAARLRVHTADDDLVDPRLYNGTRAHLAGLKGDVEGATL